MYTAVSNRIALHRIRFRKQRDTEARYIIVNVIVLPFLEVMVLIRKVTKLQPSFLIVVDAVSPRHLLRRYTQCIVTKLKMLTFSRR